MIRLSLVDNEFPAVASEEKLQQSFIPKMSLKQEFSLKNLFYYTATVALAIVN